MTENQTPAREITVLDIFKIINKKIKIIALITLVALILGAAGGAALAIISNATYGTQAEFYIYSEGANSYILSLLRSDSFAERLLLDENGLPSDKKGTEAYQKALAAKEATDKIIEEIEELEKQIKLYPTELSNLQRESNDTQAKYTEVYNHLVLYKNALKDTVFDTDAHNATIAQLEKDLAAANTAKNAAKSAYDAKLIESQKADTKLLELQEELTKLNSSKRAAFDIALSDFRKNKDNIAKIQTIKKSVTFNYENTSKDDKLIESQSHLYVNIAVKFDQQLAQELLDSISQKLPSFVEESVIAEGEERETECVFMSVFGSVESVDYKSPIVTSVKFGGIAAVAAFVLSCFVVLVIDIVKGSAKPKEQKQDEQSALEEAKD